MLSPSAEFVALWTAHSRQVYAYIFSLVRNAADADDILQETSITLLQKYEEIDIVHHFLSWACKVAQFKVLDFYKNKRDAEAFDEAFLDLVSQEVSKHIDSLDHRMEILGECLKLLPSKDRKLIELRYLRDQTVELVSEKVGRTASAVYKALSRIRESLFDCVQSKLTEGKR
jgi:RNA polymerase sigma-70 factor (ECF subfamily)